MLFRSLTTYGNGITYWSTVSGSGGGANISNGTSNVSISTSGGNVTTSVAGNANILVITGTGANISGTLSVSGNANIGNIGTAGIITSTGKVTAGAVAYANTDGTNGQVLTTYGNGTTYWSTVSGGGGSLTVTTDDFTGDGSTVAFTLSVSPTNANYTFVSLAGTFQPRTTYSVSGSVLTFTSAPPNGSAIEVSTLSGGGSSGVSNARSFGTTLVFGL